MLTRERDEDTSDTLISPFVVGLDGAVVSLRIIERWVAEVVSIPNVREVVVWMTEGFEVEANFDRLSLHVRGFATTVETLIHKEKDVPSVCVTITPDGNLSAA